MSENKCICPAFFGENAGCTFPDCSYKGGFRKSDPSTHSPVVEGGFKWVRATERLPTTGKSVAAKYTHNYTFMRVHNGAVTIGEETCQLDTEAIKEFLTMWFWLEEIPTHATEPSTGMREVIEKRLAYLLDAEKRALIDINGVPVGSHARKLSWDFIKELGFRKNELQDILRQSPEPPTPVLPEVKEGEREWIIKEAAYQAQLSLPEGYQNSTTALDYLEGFKNGYYVRWLHSKPTPLSNYPEGDAPKP